MDIAVFKSKLKEVAGFLGSEFAKIRSNRVTPALVEDILVDIYGNKTAVKGLASIKSLDARTLVIEPWDKTAIEFIAKAIANSDIGVQPIVDGKGVRMSLPQLTQERRGELTKLVSQKTEEARIKSRRLRDEAVKDANQEKSENIKFRKKDEIEKAMKESAQALEDLRAKKEKELLG